MSKLQYQTIRSPHLTEKVSDLMQKSNQYAFKVDINSTKREIKKAVESAADESETVKKIKAILDSEIRPAIAMDGGDCEFVEYTDGVLTLRMQGACSNCPSSVMTLKMGIENRLKEEIPDLQDVVQV